MEKVINRMINDAVEGVDTYKTKDSTWIIFTESKKWVIELTKDGTLWYNYNFFNDLMMYLSMDVVENQHYITKWVEDNVINGVKETCCHDMKLTKSVEKIIQKGIKNTYSDILPEEYDWSDQFDVKEVIETGVKHTEYGDWEDGDERLDDIIQNGVKETIYRQMGVVFAVEDAIQNGVKETFLKSHNLLNLVEDTIQNGVKETHDDIYHHRGRIDGVIKNGIKQTKSIDYSDNSKFIVDGVIKKGKII